MSIGQHVNCYQKYTHVLIIHIQKCHKPSVYSQLGFSAQRFPLTASKGRKQFFHSDFNIFKRCQNTENEITKTEIFGMIQE